MTKVNIFLLGLLLVLALALYFCYNRLIKVESDNTVMREDIQVLTKTLDDQVARGKEIAKVTAELEEKDVARQGEYRQFSRSLGALKKSNTEVRNLLDAHVHASALAGLRSFPNASGK